MTLVDSHVHVSDLWYEPVETLLFHLDAAGIERAFLVQVGGHHDNAYQRDCVRRFPDRFASFVSVDPRDPAFLDELRREADLGAVGVRLRHDLAAHHDDVHAVWAELQRLGLAVSLISRPAYLCSAAFAQLVTAFPGVPVLAEHMGTARRTNPDLSVETVEEMGAALAALPSVHLKVHGLGEAGSRQRPLADPPFDRAPAALLRAFDVLGAGRLVWGSDFPPVCGREGYANSFRYPREALEQHGAAPDDVAAIFGGNALRVLAASGAARL